MEDNRKDCIRITVYNNWSWTHEDCKILYEGFLYDWGDEEDNYINIMTDQGQLVRVNKGNVKFHVDTVFKPLNVDPIISQGADIACDEGQVENFAKFIKFTKDDRVLVLNEDGTMCVRSVSQVRFLSSEKEEKIEKGDSQIQKRLKSI